MLTCACVSALFLKSLFRIEWVLNKRGLSAHHTRPPFLELPLERDQNGICRRGKKKRNPFTSCVAILLYSVCVCACAPLVSVCESAFVCLILPLFSPQSWEETLNPFGSHISRPWSSQNGARKKKSLWWFIFIFGLFFLCCPHFTKIIIIIIHHQWSIKIVSLFFFFSLSLCSAISVLSSSPASSARWFRCEFDAILLPPSWGTSPKKNHNKKSKPKQIYIYILHQQ